MQQELPQEIIREQITENIENIDTSTKYLQQHLSQTQSTELQKKIKDLKNLFKNL